MDKFKLDLEALTWIIGALELKLTEVLNDPEHDDESNETAGRSVQSILDRFNDLERAIKPGKFYTIVKGA